MAGQFSKDNRPVMPGTYFDFVTVAPSPLPTNLAATVAIVFTHDWGPLKTPTLTTSFADFQQKFGTSTDTNGYVAVRNAFKGEGVSQGAGAGAVLAYRYAGSAAAKASKVLQSAEASPVNTLTITALYEGTRGNDLKVAVLDTPGTSANNDLVLYDGTVELERYTHANTDMPGLAAAINAQSHWVRAAVTGGSEAKTLWATSFTTNASASSLTAGNDGLTIAGSDVTAAYTALEPEAYSLLAWDDITPGTSPSQEATNLAALVAWATNLNNAGRRFMLVVGGAPGETITDATTRAAAITTAATVGGVDYSENVIDLGVGTYTDADMGALSTSKLATRVAGILANRGEVMSLTGSRLADLTITTGPTEAQKLTAFKAGVMTIGRDSDPTAPVHIVKAVTAYVTSSNTGRPYLIYRNPKFVRTMQGIQTEFTQWCDSNIIGRVTVNNKTRDAVRSELVSRLNSRAEIGVVQPNPTVEVDQSPPPSDNDEFLAFVVGIGFGRSAEQVYFTVQAA